MNELGRWLVRWWRKEDGQTAMEYALLGVLVSIAAILAITTIGQLLIGMFEKVLVGFQ
jgi:Flp pilus assembly pilin Flp